MTGSPAAAAPCRWAQVSASTSSALGPGMKMPVSTFDPTWLTQPAWHNSGGPEPAAG